jgi:hypothetical protein
MQTSILRQLPPAGLLPAGLMLAAVLAASACASLGSEQPAAAAAMVGTWSRDPAASDDFDRKLAPLIEHERQRMLPRHGSGGAAGSGGSGGRGGRRGGGRSNGNDTDATGNPGADDGLALSSPMEDPKQIRARLAGELRPPEALRIALPGEAVEISNDAEPVRQFLPGQPISRIDSSGAATLTSGWDQHAFVVRARYTNRAARNWRYELESAGAVLRLSFEASDPEFGQISLVTRYRRAR